MESRERARQQQDRHGREREGEEGRGKMCLSPEQGIAVQVQLRSNEHFDEEMQRQEEKKKKRREAHKGARVKRVCVIGAGAAGSAAAWSLTRSNANNVDDANATQYEVEVWEPASMAGGVATTSRFGVHNEKAMATRHVAYNDGVQGGAPSYRNTLSLLESLGHDVSTVSMKVCFGVDDERPTSGKVLDEKKRKKTDDEDDEDDNDDDDTRFHYWNNTGIPTETVRKHAADIERFGKLLKFVYANETIFIAIKISWLLRWRGYSASFADDMVYPLVALFFGTGNQTPHVPAALIARVFLDPKLKLFDYHPETLLSQQPEMFAFPSFDELYQSVVRTCDDADGAGCEFKFGRKCVSVSRDTATGQVTVRGLQRRHDHVNTTNPDAEDFTAIKGDGIERDGECIEAVFDAIIFACSAENALAILKAGSGAGFFERQALGNVRYYNDVTVTHTDYDYIMRQYSYGRLKNINTGDVKKKDDDPFNDKEMYLVRTYAHNRRLIEMSFDLSHYQPQVKYKKHESVTTCVYPEAKATADAQRAPTLSSYAATNPSVEDGEDGSLFQSIFLDDTNIDAWTIDDIDKSKIIKKKWWRQFAHCTGHYLGTVPFVRFIQRNKNTYYAGSWLTVNTHEQAVISGLAAAFMISGDYFFDADALAREQFDQYLRFICGIRRK